VEEEDSGTEEKQGA